MKSSRVRNVFLEKIGVRERSGFITLSPGGLSAIDTALERLAAKGPAGDYYEFGLYRGYTFWHAQQAARRLGLSEMRFFGFDSFEGLPEIEGQDRKSGIFIPGDYSCTKPEVERLLTTHGFDWTSAALVEGYFDRSLTPDVKVEKGMGPAALIMVDCDLYQSTVPVLAFLADRLQDGTVLIFDDWHCFSEAPDRGEPRAFREFLDSSPEWRAEHLWDYEGYGRVFVMHRVPAP